MKKMLVFVLILVFLCLTSLVKFEENPLWKFDNIGKVCFVSAENYQSDEIESVKCGDKFFNFCSLKTAKERIKLLSKNADGMQFYLQNGALDTIFDKLKYQQVSQVDIDDLTVYCGYTPYFQDCVYLDGKKVNVQIAAIGDDVIVGFPMILTGY